MESPRLLGRDREREVLNALLDQVDERGAAIVLRGEPGIGKSSLLGATADRARERAFRVLAASGVQSETQLPFAGLHQLLRPILPGLDSLPRRKRDAVLAAFGMTDEAAPDLFLIALAALDLLSDISQRSPLLVSADDAQWLDRPTSDVLSFVARRLDSDRIIMIAAVRDGFDSSLIHVGLPSLELTGLDDRASAELMRAHAPDIAPEVSARLLLEAKGNPLAIVELPSALTSEHLGGATSLPAVLPLTARLEQAFAARVADMPDATRAALLVAAVNDTGALAEVMAAASVVMHAEVSVDVMSPAISARLVEIDEDTVRFRHPLVRSAIHQAGTMTERQAAHAALGSVLVDQPDRRAWHRAASMVGPDDDAARELEQAADRAERRGALVVSVSALERAAQLTTDPNRRRKALLRACELAFELGQRDQLARLLQLVLPLALEPAEQARLIWIREMADPRIQNDPVRLHGLIDLAERANADGDRDAALNLLWLAAQRSWWRVPGHEERARIVEVAESLASADDNPQVLAIIAYGASIERAGFVIDRLARWQSEDDPVIAQLLGTAAVVVGAFDVAAGFLATSAAGLRTQGRLGHLARVLMIQGWSATYLADWTVAITAADEAGRLGTETGQNLWAGGARIVDSIIAAIRGESDLADRLSSEAERRVKPVNASFMVAGVQLARGLNALGEAKHADAFAQLRRVFDPTDPAHHPVSLTWAIGDLAEAAVLSGHRDEASDLVEHLEPLAGGTASPLFQMTMAYARAMLADDGSAERLFRVAMDASAGRWPLYRARLELMYGTWLRRQRRMAESRSPLRAAREAFDALGAVPWGERARRELRASGEASRHRVVASWDQLSPQELQIAHMAADGLSNREIGQRLFLSHRTVASHLYSVFPKLGVTARGQLQGALAPVSPAPA